MINRIVLVGRLTKDPELRFTPAGDAVCSFTLAVNRNFKTNGEQVADFLNIVVWKKQGENAATYLKKGSLAGVDGRVQTRNYEGQDGKRVYITEIVAESVQFLEPKSNDSNTGNNSSYSNNNSGNTSNKGNTSSYNSSSNSSRSNSYDDPFSNNGGQLDISDSDLPF